MITATRQKKSKTKIRTIIIFVNPMQPTNSMKLQVVVLQDGGGLATKAIIKNSHVTVYDIIFLLEWKSIY